MQMWVEHTQLSRPIIGNRGHKAKARQVGQQLTCKSLLSIH
ncbi:hypothetical protein LAB1_44350 [Roseibium sp. LAB1]